MKVELVIAHPREDSFTRALAQAYTDGLRERGHEVDWLDLYAERFDPVLPASDEARAPDKIIAYQERLNRCDGLVLAYPIWWSTPPAILVGWLQRVLSEEFAFGVREGRNRGLLPHLAQLLVSVGSQNRGGRLGALYVDPMLSVLRYCGMQVLEPVVCWGVYTGLAAEKGAQCLAAARTAGLEFGASRLEQTA